MSKLKVAIYYGDKLNTGEYDNGVWMDILKIPYISRIEEAGNYDVIIRTLWIEATVNGWSKMIRDKFPAVKQIGLSDHPLSTHISKMDAPTQIAYLADLQHLDGVLALTEEEREWYQTALPATPVIKAGLPFPFETYEARYAQFKDSERKYIGLGVGAADPDRNFISSWLVFNRLKLEYPELKGVFLSVPENLLKYCVYLADMSTDVFIQERSDMSDFYDTLAQCKLVINLADRNTPGRVQAEGAFLGVPVIGSDRLELQRELFPDLAVSPYSLEQATGIAKFLLEHEPMVFEKVEYAREKLQRYNYAASKRKFNKLLKAILEAG